MIPRDPPPKLKEKKTWTETFHDFIAKCLVKDPRGRPTAQNLLSHKFIKDVKPNATALLIDAIEKCHTLVEQRGYTYFDDNEHKSTTQSDNASNSGGSNNESDDEEDEDDDDDEDGAGTVRSKQRGKTEEIIEDDEDDPSIIVDKRAANSEGSTEFGTVMAKGPDQRQIPTFIKRAKAGALDTRLPSFGDYAPRSSMDKKTKRKSDEPKSVNEAPRSVNEAPDSQKQPLDSVKLTESPKASGENDKISNSPKTPEPKPAEPIVPPTVVVSTFTATPTSNAPVTDTPVTLNVDNKTGTTKKGRANTVVVNPTLTEDPAKNFGLEDTVQAIYRKDVTIPLPFLSLSYISPDRLLDEETGDISSTIGDLCSTEKVPPLDTLQLTTQLSNLVKTLAYHQKRQYEVPMSSREVDVNTKLTKDLTSTLKTIFKV